MEQLLNAAKALLEQRETYFQRHPEVECLVTNVEDDEYEDAWNALQAAVDANTPDHASN